MMFKIANFLVDISICLKPYPQLLGNRDILTHWLFNLSLLQLILQILSFFSLAIFLWNNLLPAIVSYQIKQLFLNDYHLNKAVSCIGHNLLISSHTVHFYF